MKQNTKMLLTKYYWITVYSNAFQLHFDDPIWLTVANDDVLVDDASEWRNGASRHEFYLHNVAPEWDTFIDEVNRAVVLVT